MPQTYQPAAAGETEFQRTVISPAERTSALLNGAGSSRPARLLQFYLARGGWNVPPRQQLTNANNCTASAPSTDNSEHEVFHTFPNYSGFTHRMPAGWSDVPGIERWTSERHAGSTNDLVGRL